MGLIISNADHEELVRIAKSAEHYPEDSPEMKQLEGVDYDMKRVIATLAQMALDGKFDKE